MDTSARPTQFAVVVLAAGGSSRLGQPKQLVQFEGQALVRRATQTAIESGATEVIVVVGSHAATIAAQLEGLPATIVRNDDWASGMASSIRLGVKSVAHTIDALVLTLVDTPFVTATHLNELAEAVLSGGVAEQHHPVAATLANDVLCPPCAFARTEFGMLTGLSGDTGARAILKGRQDVARIQFEPAAFDIDSQSDLDRLAELS